ncbi:hypothetical protein DL98DRAFT_107084 [Cadophora sp. DSE1049]|nr:hypothetical protein DL98DRAFT_107084 [Cadophora sp. DSE1049]
MVQARDNTGKRKVHRFSSELFNSTLELMEASQLESQVSAQPSDQLLSLPPSDSAEYPTRTSSSSQDPQQQTDSWSFHGSDGSTNAIRNHPSRTISRIPVPSSSISSASKISTPKEHDPRPRPQSGIAHIWNRIMRTESDTWATEIASLLLSIAILIYILLTL